MPLDSDGRERPFKGLVQSRRRTTQPQGVVGVDWSNPITKGLEFAILPGQLMDSARKIPAGMKVGVDTSLIGSSVLTPGTNRDNGITVRTGSLLGPLQNSTVIGVARTTAALVLAGSETDGLIGTGGNAIYCERGASGNDIYKLGLIHAAGVLQTEFTYRNDAGALLQHRVEKPTNDGAPHFYALTKDGTVHTVFADNLKAVGTFPSGSSAFTNSVQMMIGSDKGDSSAAWNGFIDLVAGWSRTLSDIEILSLYDNPWQLLAPAKSNHALSLLPKRQVWTPRQTRMLGTSSGSVATVAIQTSKSIVRRSQPQGAVESANVFGLKPEILWIGSNPVADSAGGSWSRGTTPVDVVTEFGRAVRFTSSSPPHTLVRTGGNTSAQTRFTFVTVFRYTEYAPYQSPVGLTNTNQGVYFGDVSGGGAQFGITKGGVVSLSPVTLAINTPYVLVASHRQDTGEYYIVARSLVDGSILRASSTNTSASSAGSGTYSIGLPGDIALAFASFDFLPEALAYAVLDNPYQLFAPRKSKIWVPA